MLTLFQEEKLNGTRGPGENLASRVFVIGLFSACFWAKAAFGLDLLGDGRVSPYSQPVETGSRLQAQEAQNDRKRVIDRNQRFQFLQRREAERQKETEGQSQQAQEVAQAVSHGRQFQEATAQREKQWGDELVSRTTNYSSYSYDKDNGKWISIMGLTVEGINVLAGRDLYDNESRGHYTQFQYNNRFNVEGLTMEVTDAAGRFSRTVVSGITYLVEYFRGIAQKGEENRKGAEDSVTTTFHPTGESTTRTETRNLQYDGKNRVIGQESTSYDLTGPNPPVYQNVRDMSYDGEGNVASSFTETTDLGTGVVTQTTANNRYSGRRLVSGVTQSVTKDPINHTRTEQTFTQNVSYHEGRIGAIEANGVSTATAMDEAGNPVHDFASTTKTTQTMGLFHNIPQPVRIATETKTIDNVGVQEISARQEQVFDRDSQGNLLQTSASETGTVTNADLSVTQRTKSGLAFEVHGDQFYLVGRDDEATVEDGIEETTSTGTSHLRIRLGTRHEVLGGEEIGDRFTTNGDGSITTTTSLRQLFDRAEKANALALVSRETISHNVDQIHYSDTEERRLYSQAHDAFNRILGAEETMNSRATTIWGGITETEGKFEYGAGLRSNQPYLLRSSTHSKTSDPFQFLYTEATQTQTFDVDAQTGRAHGARGVTEAVSKRMKEDGTVMENVLTLQSHSEDTLTGLAQANGVGLSRQETFSQTLDHVNSLRTDQKQVLTQEMNGVGKIREARAETESFTGDADGSGIRQTEGLAQTVFRVIANSHFTDRTKRVEITKDRTNGSYRVVAKEDANRYDPYGRMLAFDEAQPEASGYQTVSYYDVTITPIPKQAPPVKAWFHQFFGTEAPR